MQRRFFNVSRKYLFPILALCGLLFALFMVFYGAQKPPIPPIEFPPPTSPFKHSIAGYGIVEPASREIRIAAPFSEIVTEVMAKVGAQVKKGAPLFKLNTETLEAKYQEALWKREAAKNRYEDHKLRLARLETLLEKSALSEDRINQIYFAEKRAFAEYKEADAALDLIATQIERSTVLAPMNGQVLQVGVRVGEAAETHPSTSSTPILFGQTEPLHIRVSIDEDDAFRMEQNAPAIATVRGNRSISIPLTFLHIEPIITPKQTLSGENQERVDTRVLQILYSFERNQLPIYPGQMMDIFIEARTRHEAN